MKCTICHEEVVLVPSAAERAKKFGGPPSQYTKRFTEHSTCITRKRNAETLELLKRLR